MLTQEQAVEIRVMARRGEGVRAIARQLGCSRNTVRRTCVRKRQAVWAAAAAAVQARRLQGATCGNASSRRGRAGFRRWCCCARSGARLRRRDQAAQGVARAAQADRARTGGALRDGAGRADAGRLHARAPRARPAAGVRGDPGLQPRQLRAVHRRRRRGDAVRRAARGASTTSAACPSMCCSTTPRQSSSNAMPTARGCTAGTTSCRRWPRSTASGRGCAGRTGPRPRARSSASTAT